MSQDQLYSVRDPNYELFVLEKAVKGSNSLPKDLSALRALRCNWLWEAAYDAIEQLAAKKESHNVDECCLGSFLRDAWTNIKTVVGDIMNINIVDASPSEKEMVMSQQGIFTIVLLTSMRQVDSFNNDPFRLFSVELNSFTLIKQGYLGLVEQGQTLLHNPNSKANIRLPMFQEVV